MSLCSLQDAEGKFTHEGLAVGRAFASNDEVGILQEVIEMDFVQQKVDARTTLGIHILQERIAQAACSTCTRHVLAVTAQMLGRGLRKAFGASIKGLDHFWCCALDLRSSLLTLGNRIELRLLSLNRKLLRRKNMCSTFLATKRISDIRCYREVHVIQLAHIIP